MPLSPTANMSLVLPTPGGDIGTWGDELSTALTLVDTHDHSTGKGVPIGVAGLSIAGDLTFQGNSATNLKSADFGEVAALSTGARRIFFSSADHELYVRSAGGVNIKITSGTGLNMSLVGGIVGDYAAVGAEVAYDDANDRYTFKQQLSAGVKQWARLDGADLDLYEYKAAGDASNIVNRVRLSSPAALGASYALTLPAALPGSQLALQITSGGVMTLSNTFPQAVTLTGGIANNVSLAAGATLASGQTLDTSAGGITGGAITGTAITASTAYKHSYLKTLIVPVSMTMSASATYANEFSELQLGTSTGNNVYPIPLLVGDRIKEVRLYINKTANTSTVTVTLRRNVDSAATPQTIATTSNSGNPGYVTMGLTGLSYTAISGEQYYLLVTGGGIAGDLLFRVEVDYDHP